MKNIAIVGAGYWGKNLVRNFHQLGALAAICDPSDLGKTHAQQFAPEVPVYDTMDAVLASDEIQGVVIATPAVTHAEMTLKALQSGKDVFCEKPLALKYSDAKQVARCAQELERMVMVGHILEYHPAILKMREMVAQGDLGKIQYIYSNRLNLGKIRKEENILWSFAPHDIAVILRLVGSVPFQVIASGGNYVQANIADVTVTQLAFDNGVAAHIFVSWLNPFKEQKLVVVGSKRMMTFDDVRKELLLYDQRVDLKEGEPIPVKADAEKIEYPADEPLRAECQAFLNAIETRQPPLTDARSGLDVLKVLQAAQRSLITHGQTVLLPMEF